MFKGRCEDKKGHPEVMEGRWRAVALSCVANRRIKSVCC